MGGLFNAIKWLIVEDALRDRKRHWVDVSTLALHGGHGPDLQPRPRHYADHAVSVSLWIYYACRVLQSERGAVGGNPPSRWCAWASQAGAAFSNPFISELADVPVSESLTRCANGPACKAKVATEIFNHVNFHFRIDLIGARVIDI